MRFRHRLALTFVAVTAITAGVLAITSYVLTRHYRMQAFDEQTRRQARVGLLSARGEVTTSQFETLLADFQDRGGFSTVAVRGGLTYSSSPAIGAADLPRALANPGPGELLAADTSVDGTDYRVLVGRSAAAEADLYFFFSKHGLESSLASFRWALITGWVAAVAVAAAGGLVVARRTLRPVRSFADASRSLAEGLLATRLDPNADELGSLARSFNEMADALSVRIGQLEAAAARERRLSVDVAHELRTPLAGMVSAASLVEAGLEDVPDDLRRPVELLLSDVHRLGSLVGELLELAHLDAGQEPVALEELALVPALATVARPRDGEEPVAVRVDGDPSVWADPARFRRVMTNLLANARQHGSTPIEVAAAQVDAEVRVDVLDRGPGVPAGLEDEIFDRFVKADPARSARGSGLGLAIARGHAVAQGGRLEVRARDGGGTCFRLTLRAADGPRPPDGRPG